MHCGDYYKNNNGIIGGKILGIWEKIFKLIYYILILAIKKFIQTQSSIIRNQINNYTYYSYVLNELA